MSLAPVCKSCGVLCDNIGTTYIVYCDAFDWVESETYVCCDLCVDNFRESVIDFPDENWEGLGFRKVVE